MQVVKGIVVQSPFVQGNLGGSTVHQFFAQVDADDSHGKVCPH
jgi:hypothetical protein